MYNGDYLKKIRLLKGLNQTGIAKKLGITQQAYSKMENHGNIDEKKFTEIIKIIGCAERELEIIRNHFVDGD